MNVLIVLTPKSQVAYLEENYTLRQTLEKMEFHRYTAMPIIDKFGKYAGTITEGDLLWYIKNHQDLSIHKAENFLLKNIKRHKDNKPINANATIDSLLNIVIEQNFVPIVDDQNTFIGIVTRKSIIKYLIDNK